MRVTRIRRGVAGPVIAVTGPRVPTDVTWAGVVQADSIR